MAKNCYICNKQDGGVEKTKVNIFDTKTPISDKKVSELLFDISGIVVREKCKEQNNLCAKCYKKILEYDYLLARLNEMKTETTNNINRSEDIRLKEDEIKLEIQSYTIKKEATFERDLKKKVPLVVPASKLKPLPPGFNLKLSKYLTKTSPVKMEKLTTEVQVQNKTTQNIDYKVPLILPNQLTTLLNNKQLSFNDFVVVKEKDDDNNDDRPMEIDEDAVIMETENGIISVVSHQKFLYGNSELALVMPDGDVLDQHHDDGQDSNSDHIELQVSGDEETAKAIIAATNEQGGTFIKVGSGEMYEVKSVESKINDVSQSTEDILRLDENMVEVDGDKFKCLFCERINKNENADPVTGDAEWMMLHLKAIHSARLYLCNCGAIIRKRVDFSAHIEQHANSNSVISPETAEKLSKLHECGICKKKFSSRLVLSGHMNSHTGERPYTCDICDRSFASRYTRQAHMKTHTDRPRPYICNQCGKAFLTPHNLQHHEKIHSGTKDFVCKCCGKAFGSQHNLEVHGVIHTGVKPFVCTVCDKGFARRAEVKDHMRIHTGERPFECETCGARFSQRSNLHSHRRATHLQDKRHECPHCPKRFKRRRLLEYHIKSTHTGERPLQCTVCDATFIYPEHHKKHMRIHTGEKPFVCEVCGKGFNSRDNRNVHRFTHSDRKPYECVLCGAGYMRKNQLYQHMNITGHLSESIVVNQPRVTQIEDEESKIQSVIISGDGKDSKILETVYESDLQALAADAENVVVTQTAAPSQYILATGTKTMDEIQECETVDDDCTFISIENLEQAAQIDGTVLENLTSDQLEQAHLLSDGNNTLRLIQIQLADGGCGWVAVSQ
ncbi:unnamed protein product [Pieris macdunnoughi]|uniref:C2H2-type domain-containing protein n=1 Tax=Pieris macdunnoughi TaxID=345717 RepID=A0A821UE44_9NEOP|nr:unnamed protein product [Pieris macdunnoughi]